MVCKLYLNEVVKKKMRELCDLEEWGDLNQVDEVRAALQGSQFVLDLEDQVEFQQIKRAHKEIPKKAA